LFDGVKCSAGARRDKRPFRGNLRLFKGRHDETLRVGGDFAAGIGLYSQPADFQGITHMSGADVLKKLAEHGVTPTPQRLEVAGVLLERPQHLSADQILERLREAGSRVSKATVYNTLKLFGERGLIRELTVDPDRRYYDSTTHAHHHFFNVGTGELSDIPEDQVEILKLPALPAGTEQESVEVLIRVRDKR
jgi:Fur family iron response transcriptional regulator